MPTSTVCQGEMRRPYLDENGRYDTKDSKNDHLGRRFTKESLSESNILQEKT